VVDNLCFLEDDDSATGTGDGLRFDGRAGGSAVLLFLSLSLSLSVMESSNVVCRPAPAGLESREDDIT
jgi:hypothetical protein